MKQLIIIAALFLASFSARAQATSISIYNGNQNCDLYFELIGDVGSGCGTKYFSSLITIGPNTTLTFANPAMVPGGVNCSACSPTTLGTSDVFTGVRIFDNNTTNCTLTTYDLGETCTTLPPGIAYDSYNGGCVRCGTINATYYPSNGPGMALLTFY